MNQPINKIFSSGSKVKTIDKRKSKLNLYSFLHYKFQWPGGSTKGTYEYVDVFNLNTAYGYPQSMIVSLLTMKIFGILILMTDLASKNISFCKSKWGERMKFSTLCSEKLFQI